MGGICKIIEIFVFTNPKELQNTSQFLKRKLIPRRLNTVKNRKDVFGVGIRK